MTETRGGKKEKKNIVSLELITRCCCEPWHQIKPLSVLICCQMVKPNKHGFGGVGLIRV